VVMPCRSVGRVTEGVGAVKPYLVDDMLIVDTAISRLDPHHITCTERDRVVVGHSVSRLIRLFHTIKILICENVSIEESDSLDVVQIGSCCALLLRAKAEAVILHVYEVVPREHLDVIAYDQAMSFFGLEPHSRLNVFWLPRAFHSFFPMLVLGCFTSRPIQSVVLLVPVE
jgi:hypothetical protein